MDDCCCCPTESSTYADTWADDVDVQPEPTYTYSYVEPEPEPTYTYSYVEPEPEPAYTYSYVEPELEPAYTYQPVATYEAPAMEMMGMGGGDFGTNMQIFVPDMPEVAPASDWYTVGSDYSMVSNVQADAPAMSEYGAGVIAPQEWQPTAPHLQAELERIQALADNAAAGGVSPQATFGRDISILFEGTSPRNPWTNVYDNTTYSPRF